MTSTQIASTKPSNKTLAYQDKLPKLPIPPLEETCNRYLRALEALQDEKDHELTKAAVQEFLETDGPKLHEMLKEYAQDKDSYIEEFWYESYLSHSDPVVLALNPFFVLENDPTPDRGSQLPRAASLVVSSLGFIHDLRAGILEPDVVRGTPLDMDQYSRLFGTSRIPTDRGCRMEVHSESRHIVVLRRGQFYWFDVLDENNLPVLTEREVLRNLQAIITDADKTDQSQAARGAIGVLSTENRKVWSDSGRFSRRIETTSLALTLWIMHFSLCAWMMPPRRTLLTCAVTFCVGHTVFKEASRLERVPIGGMISSRSSFVPMELLVSTLNILEWMDIQY